MHDRTLHTSLLFLSLGICMLLSNTLLGQACCCSGDSEIEVPGGDFEVSPAPAPGGWIDYSAGDNLGPWDVVSGSVSHHDDGHNNLGDGNPNPSTAHLDLNGFSAGGGVCQDISGFTIGAEYEIEFFYAIHNAINSASAIVQIDGGNALDEGWSAGNQGQNSWDSDSYSFFATAETMSFCFYSDSFVACCGMLIDDITLYCLASDEEDPELLQMPPDESYDCIDDVIDDVVEAIDDCTTDIEVELVEDYSSNNFCLLTIMRTYTAEDDCGNIAEHVQVIEILEDVPPEVIESPEDFDLSCDDDGEFLFEEWVDNWGEAEVEDNCGPVFMDVDYAPFDFDSCGVYEIEFTFTDNCLNESIEYAFFEIYDDVPPIFDIAPNNLILGCDDDAMALIEDWLAQNGLATISDNCSYGVEHDFNGDYTASQTVNFMATDLCGLTSSASADIIIDNNVVVISIDTISCDPNQESIVEVLIDNPFCDTLLRYNYTIAPTITSVGDRTTCDPNEVGVDTTIYTSVLGCDSFSVVTRTLVFADTVYSQLETCDASRVSLDTLFLLNANNCDSLVVVNTILEPSDTLFFDNQTCDASLVSLDTFFYLNANDCDSLVIVNTSWSAGDTLYSDVATCDINLVSLDTLFLLNVDDCDSLVITSTYFAQNDTMFVTEFSCEISQPQIMSTVIPGPICDTILVSEILPLESDMITLDINSCILSESGIFTETLTNLVGCDSVIVTNVEYVPIDTSFVNAETCLLSELEQDTMVFVSLGCDSVVVFSTILLPGNQTNLEEVVCDSLVAISDTMYFQNIVGCDSLIITDYIYNPIRFEAMLEYDPCVERNLADILIIDLNGSSGTLEFSLEGSAFSDDTRYMDLDEGTYTVLARDLNGCVSDPLDIVFQASEEIQLDLPVTVTIERGESYQIDLEFSEAPQTFYWSNPDLVSCIDCLDPFVTADASTQLTLFYLDEYGCEKSHTIMVEVTEEELMENDIVNVYIPNIFSPNGDGVDDVFQIFTNVSSLELETCAIYDRWGNKVFENSTSLISELKWDGTHLDKNVVPGVYVYLIVIRDSEGNLESFSSDITVIR